LKGILWVNVGWPEGWRWGPWGGEICLLGKLFNLSGHFVAPNGVAYVAALSLWALVSGLWSAWQAARVEVAQKKQEERRAAEDMAGKIVERVVEETTVEKQR
jgi:hypothetical protein